MLVVAEDRPSARADVLDPDRGPVHPDRVPAPDPQVHELVDRPVGVDQEVRAHPRLLAQMRAVRREVVPRGVERGPVRVVLDDDLGIRELVRALAVVALRVARPSAACARAPNGIFFQTICGFTSPGSGGARPRSRRDSGATSDAAPRPAGRARASRDRPQALEGALAPEELERLGQRRRDRRPGDRGPDGLRTLRAVQAGRRGELVEPGLDRLGGPTGWSVASPRRRSAGSPPGAFAITPAAFSFGVMSSVNRNRSSSTDVARASSSAPARAASPGGGARGRATARRPTGSAGTATARSSSSSDWM